METNYMMNSNRSQTTAPNLDCIRKEFLLLKERYKILRVIGRGSSALVVLAQERASKEQVAIKYMKVNYENDFTMMKTLREIQILRHLRQMEENIHTVKILDMIVSECMTDIFLVLNYVQSDLKKALSMETVGLDEDHTKLILYKMLCGLHFIHQANIIHRDIKPSNYLIDQNCDIFLCDFGLARTLAKVEQNKKDHPRQKMSQKLLELQPERQKQKRKLSPHVVTRNYRPPEVILLEKKYRTTVDIWSAGCILSELLAAQDQIVLSSSPRTLSLQKNQAMFNGQSCTPLSPCVGDQVGQDQLDKILQTLGVQDEQDLSFLTILEQAAYINGKAQKKSKINFSEEFPKADQEIVQVLSNMLEFNPFFRQKASKLLCMDMFEKLIKKLPEYLVPPPYEIVLEIDKKGVFDYEKGRFVLESTRERVKALIRVEFETIKSM